MSAAEVIEMIKKLSPEEQAEVREFMRQGTPAVARTIKYLSDEDFDRVAKQVFAKNHELLRRLAIEERREAASRR